MNRLLRLLSPVVLIAGMTACGSKPKEEAPWTSGPAQDISSPASPVQADERPVIVALGNSLTAGLGVNPKENYPSQLQARLDATGYRYRVVNAGVSGDTSAQGLNRLSAVRALHPALVIVELGANDGLRGLPIEQTRSNLDEIIRTLREDGTRIILAGMEIPPNYGPEYTRQFRSVFRDLAAIHKLRMIPFFLEGVGGIAELNQEDSIHPNAPGYSRVTENVWRVLEPIVKRGS